MDGRAGWHPRLHRGHGRDGGCAPPPGATRREIPAARYAVFNCLVRTIGETYGYVYNQWLLAGPYEFDEGKADFEYYPPGSTGNESPAAIYIPVRRKS